MSTFVPNRTVPFPEKLQYAIEPVFSTAQWTAFLLPAAFPLPVRDREPLRNYLAHVLEVCSRGAGTQRSTWLQMHAFPTDDTPQLLATHGRQWRPQLGLGVWPDREPPRTWLPTDFTDRDWGTELPTLMYSVFFLSGPPPGAQHGWETMTGTGSTVTAVLEGEARTFHEALRSRLSGPIRDPALQNKQFYMPLLDISSLRRLKAELSEHLPGVHLYIRESIEDKSVILLIRTLYAAELQKQGLLPRFELLPTDTPS